MTAGVPPQLPLDLLMKIPTYEGLIDRLIGVSFFFVYQDQTSIERVPEEAIEALRAHRFSRTYHPEARPVHSSQNLALHRPSGSELGEGVPKQRSSVRIKRPSSLVISPAIWFSGNHIACDRPASWNTLSTCRLHSFLGLLAEITGVEFVYLDMNPLHQLAHCRVIEVLVKGVERNSLLV
ncbi:MAG: hypothetical protein QUS11_02945 [Candidatus Fermentibacter sp.]|nr:hypothetical protein [Candidatus Fermentibacter sp.]